MKMFAGLVLAVVASLAVLFTGAKSTKANWDYDYNDYNTFYYSSSPIHGDYYYGSPYHYYYRYPYYYGYNRYYPYNYFQRHFRFRHYDRDRFRHYDRGRYHHRYDWGRYNRYW